MWFRRDPAAEKIKQLHRLLPNPFEHRVLEQRTTENPHEHGCTVEERYAMWCVVRRMYNHLSEDQICNVEALWQNLESFQHSMGQLGDPVEMRGQWLLLLEQALAVAEALMVEMPAAKRALTKAKEDAELVQEAESVQVQEAQDSLAVITTGIRDGSRAVHHAAIAADEAVKAKVTAEELAAAYQRRALNGAPSSEAALRASRLAGELTRSVASLEQFSGEVRASTRTLQELTA